MNRFLLLVILCLFSVPARASIVLSGDYVIDGACVDQCDFLTLRMSVGGTGPVHTSPNTGFTILSFLTVTNDQGDIGNLGADFNNIGDRSRSLTGLMVSPFATTPGGILHVSINTLLVSSSCCVVPDVSVDVSLPPGLTMTAVPETSTWAMMLLGFAALSWLSYRRRGHASCQ
jgi:hypothetical protein